jgi:predicted DNA binding CopG/RHH family protein
MKKSLYLDEEEQDLKKALNHGEWHPVKNVKDEIGKHLQYARNTLLKDKRVNIRISSTDLEALQTKAVEEGLPYQTFIASVLHKFAAGRLLAKQH